MVCASSERIDGPHDPGESLRVLGLIATVALKAGLMNCEAKVTIVAPLSELHALGKSLARS